MPRTTGDYLPGTKIRIEIEAGHGAFGVVYKGYDEALARDVAVKELRRDALGMGSTRFDEYTDRFRREAQVQAQFNHPNIVHVYDLAEEGDTLYLVMEYVEGRTLRDELTARGPLPIDEAVRITLDILDALQVVHTHPLDVVHRDIKPSNVLLSAAGRAKLTDFGLAQVGGESSRSRLGSGRHPGTPLYMSPEQETTIGYLRAASDLYSVGCVLFELLTGAAYKPLDNDPGALRRLRPDVSPALDEILKQAVAEERRARYQCAADLATALRAMQAEEAAARAAETARQAAALEADRRAEALRQAEAARRSAEAESARRQAAAVEAARQQRRAVADARKQQQDAAARVVTAGSAADGGRSDQEQAAPTPTHDVRTLRPRTPPAITTVVLLGAVLLIGLGALLVRGGRPPTTSTPAPIQTGAPAVAAATATPSLILTPTLTPTALPPEASVPTLGAGATRIRERDGMEQVWVPGGSFDMGSKEWEADERPVHRVTLDAFWLDRTEVTNGQYSVCVQAGKCVASRYAGNSSFNGTLQPVVGVTWHDAVEYCEWVGGRLPTEAEWEYAARGPEGRRYPWGDEFDGTRLNYCDTNCQYNWADKDVDDGYERAAPVGSYEEGASWVGAMDLAGNVWEWVGDWYAAYPLSVRTNPTGPDSGGHRVLRGGSWTYDVWSVRSASRNRNDPTNSSVHLGFRCASPQSP